MLIVSISGVRGIVGTGLTPAVVSSFGQAYAGLLPVGTRVSLARDSRPSGEMVRGALVAGLLAGGAEVVELGVVSTPAAALMTRRLGCGGGVMVSASHNPVEWNGLKFFSAEGRAIPSELGARIKAAVADAAVKGPARAVGAADMRPVREDFREICRWARERKLPPAELWPMLPDRRAAVEHVRTVLATLDADTLRAVRRRRFKVALDAVNGSGGSEGLMLLSELDCTVVPLNCEPDGRFAHVPEPLAENLTGLCEAVRAGACDAGFAQDPDADRLAVVDGTGRYIGEEYTLALAADFVLSRTPGPVAANLSTSRLIDAVAARHKVPVHRTPVGELNVADAMVRHGCAFGGEGNGGVIDPRVGLVRDSLVGMATVLASMAVTGKSVAELVAGLPALHMVKSKFECAPDRAAAMLAALRKRHAGARINESDGLRIDFDDGWVHLRASNTEPVFRVIAEAGSPAAARSLVDRTTAECKAV